MNRRAPAALLVGVLLVSCAVSVVRHGELDPTAATRVERGISTVRNLPFRRPVPMEVTTPEQLRRHLTRELRREYEPAKLAAVSTVYSLLGLLPSGIDLEREILRLYESQVAGFYEPRAAKLYLVDPPPALGSWWLRVLEALLRRDLVGEMLLAHELTHALQDQNFDVVGRMTDPLDDDRALAAAAAIEGDATLAGFAYLLGGLPTESLLALVDRLQAIPTEVAASLPDSPTLLRETLAFRYSSGARFAAWAYLRAGWDGVNAILVSPPESTEQVLWPEKYYVEPDAPTTVDLGGLDDYRTEAPGSLIEENTLGALLIRILFSVAFSPDRAEWIARGWDGDRFAAWSRGGRTHLYWMTAWDSVRDAKDFLLAEREALERRFPSSAVAASPDRAASSFPSPWFLERRGAKVLVILGVPSEECSARAEALWAKTTFSTRRPEPPFDLALHR
jgi:hypothetical protein